LYERREVAERAQAVEVFVEEEVEEEDVVLFL
jgi:hypothetical protein